MRGARGGGRDSRETFDGFDRNFVGNQPQRNNIIS